MLKVDVQGLCQVLHVQPGADWGEGGEPTRHHQASQIHHDVHSHLFPTIIKKINMYIEGKPRPIPPSFIYSIQIRIPRRVFDACYPLQKLIRNYYAERLINVVHI
jgi:hypothetical protein